MIEDPNLSKIYKLLHQLAVSLSLTQKSIRAREETHLEQLRSFAHIKMQKAMKRHFPDEEILMPADPTPPVANSYHWRFYPIMEEENFMRGSIKWTLAITGHLHGRLHKTLILEGSRNDYYWARRNGGSYGKFGRLRVSSTQELGQTSLSCDIHRGIPCAPPQLSRKTCRILNSGSWLLNAIECAAGDADVFYAEARMPVISPIVLLLEEAGGLVCDEKGRALNKASQSVLAANDQLLVQIIKERLFVPT